MELSERETNAFEEGIYLDFQQSKKNRKERKEKKSKRSTSVSEIAIQKKEDEVNQREEAPIQTESKDEGTVDIEVDLKRESVSTDKSVRKEEVSLHGDENVEALVHLPVASTCTENSVPDVKEKDITNESKRWKDDSINEEVSFH